MEGLKNLIKKPWFWLVIGGVALLALMSRRGGKTASGAPIPMEEPEAFRIAGGGLAQGATEQRSVLDQFIEGMQLRGLKREEELEEFSFQQAKAEQSLYSQLFGQLSGKGGKRPEGVKCPEGQPRIDPETGQIYCRTKTGKGFFQGVNAGQLIDLATGVFGGRVRNTTRAPSGGTGSGYTNPFSQFYESRRPGS